MPPTPQKQQSIKSINLAELHKIDINDLGKIDVQSVIKDFTKRPDKLIVVLAPILALFISVNIYSNTKTTQRTQTSQIAANKDKIKLMEEYNETQGNLTKFFETMPPKITDTQLVDKITDIAQKRGVQIDSYSPAENKNNPLFDLTIISLLCSAQNYQDIWLFIHDIEHAKLNIRIDSWSANISKELPRQGFNKTNNNGEVSIIKMRIEIAAVSLKK